MASTLSEFMQEVREHLSKMNQRVGEECKVVESGIYFLKQDYYYKVNTNFLDCEVNKNLKEIFNRTLNFCERPPDVLS